QRGPRRRRARPLDCWEEEKRSSDGERGEPEHTRRSGPGPSYCGGRSVGLGLIEAAMVAAAIAVAHEAVEFLAVARLAQVGEVLLEGLELFVEPPAFLVEALELLLAIGVEGGVAGAGKALVGVALGAALPDAFGCLLHPGLRLVLAAAAVLAPEDVGEHRRAERPEDDEAQHHQGDGNRRPGRLDQCAV